MRNRSVVAVVVGAVALALNGDALSLRAQAPSPAPVAPAPTTADGKPDLSGFWELRFDSRNVPPARLTPRITPALLAAAAKKDLHAIRWCNMLGTPFIMGDARVLDVRQGPIEVAIVPETYASARHIYTDGRPHVDPEIFDPQTNGNSVGRWDGDTLVVETIGFSDKGVTAIPGGGFRTPDSRLTERFRLIGNGAQLSIMSTWTDPKMFRTPHTYEFRYYRAAKNYTARSVACNAFDEERARFLTEPPRPPAGTDQRKPVPTKK
jgi:hypothetical protein